MGLRAAERLASLVWATLVRLNILKRAMLDRRPGCVLGSMSREPADGTGSWVKNVASTLLAAHHA